MDPAAGVFSPFSGVARGSSGLVAHAVAELDAPPVPTQESNLPQSNGTSHAAPNSRRTLCSACEVCDTAVTVPPGGTYLCPECAAHHVRGAKGSRFPPNTLKCCPASVTEGEGGVVRCYSCGSWYHFACLEIHDRALKEFLALSTTKWYCPEPSCCENVLQEKLKRKR